MNNAYVQFFEIKKNIEARLKLNISGIFDEGNIEKRV